MILLKLKGIADIKTFSFFNIKIDKDEDIRYSTKAN